MFGLMSLTHFLEQPAGSTLVVAYSTVLLAELVGDKSVYTVAALGSRFRPWPVFAGIGLAFMGKMLAAVLLGRIILEVPERWTTILSAGGFFACAIFLWLREPGGAAVRSEEPASWPRAVAVSFSTLFSTEWCDPGQIAAAALTARTQAALMVWIGGTFALMTKGTLAMTLGAKLSKVLPERLIRTTASATCGVLGVLSLARLFGR
jgi:putative Ca2+/H+ antiporter (TMEM165/GDT1 family)